MISVDAAALEAKYGKVSGQPQPAAPIGDLYAPGMNTAPNQQGQVPHGTPIPEGQFIQQVVGRGIAVVPPQEHKANQPQVAVVPPQGGNRTTIGTIIEPKKSSPLAGAKLPEPDPATPVQPLKPKRDLDLAKLILEHIWELGGEKSEAAQKFYDRSHDTLKKWVQNPAIITLGAISKFLARNPGVKADILDELEPHFAYDAANNLVESLPNRTKKSVVVCTPVLDRPTLPWHWSCLYLAKKYECGFQNMSDTVIHRSRNMLAKRFLDSGALWSLWLDSDMAAPIKNPDWYKWITGAQAIPHEWTNYDFLERLESSGKAIVGAVYTSRRYHGQLVVQPEIRPRSHEDRLLCNDIRKGTARGLVEVDWIGFGCAWVHREVFLHVQRAFPKLAPEAEFLPWRFFQPEGDEGEDEAFCRRVKACDIPIWLDTQLVCPHMGTMAYMPEHSAPPPM